MLNQSSMRAWSLPPATERAWSACVGTCFGRPWSAKSSYAAFARTSAPSPRQSKTHFAVLLALKVSAHDHPRN
jgi:hypothetical protein